MRTNPLSSLLAPLLLLVATPAAAAENPLFADALKSKLGEGWSWIHESPDAWKIDGDGLHLRAVPGTLWGGENDGRNQLVRATPEGDVVVEVTVHMDSPDPPQWEQAGLLWYVDDDNFVKLVKEDEHEKWNIVMGKEEEGRTTVLCVTPVEDGPLRLRLEVRGKKIVGRYRLGDGEWKVAAECEFAPEGKPHIGLHAQRGPADAEHWIRMEDLSVERAE
ncbi:hypothetical protein BH23VER1_BH23VER1_28790 [soil metagenome]